MKRSLPRTSESQNPLFQRVAGKWYSWASMALTGTAAYLAADGQLKILGPASLAAAPPVAGQPVQWAPAQSNWQPAPTAPQGVTVQGPALSPPIQAVPQTYVMEGPNLQYAPQVAAPVQYIPQPQTLPTEVAGPEVITVPSQNGRPMIAPRAGAVLNAYTQSPPVTTVQYQEVPQIAPLQAPVEVPQVLPSEPQFQLPTVPTPVAPKPTTAAVNPQAPPPVPTVNLPVAPRPVNLVPTAPLMAPARTVAREAIPQAPPEWGGNQLAQDKVNTLPKALDGTLPEATPFVPPTPAAPTPKGSTLPSVTLPGATLPGTTTQPGVLPPVEETETPQGALNYDEQLDETERTLVNAARNAVKLKNNPLAVDRFDKVIKSLERKRKLDIASSYRDEYAGLLVSMGEYRRAIDQYRKIMENLPQGTPPEVVSRYKARLGDVLIIVREYREAIALYRQALELQPRSAEHAVRLARAYSFNNDLPAAGQVYDRFLGRIAPDDPKAPLALGALLNDLERPSEALPFLLSKRGILERALQNPRAEGTRFRELDLLEILKETARAYARLGERMQAMDAVSQMAEKQPDQAAIRLALADILMGYEEFELAGQVYNQVLTNNATDGKALVGMARVHLDMYQPMQARRILDSFVPDGGNQRGYLLAYGIYHQQIGEYVEAKQIYRDMLRRNEADHEVRLQLAYLLDSIQEWEKAKAEYAKIPPAGTFGKRARLGFALALSHQRKFLEAAEVAKVLVSEDPTDATALSAMIRYLAKGCQYEQAIAISRGYLASNPRSELSALTVRLALGRALLDANRYAEAAREFEIALSRPIGRITGAYYGLARASEKLGNTERAAQLISCVGGLVGGDLRNRLMLSDLYDGDHDDFRALEQAQLVAKIDPDSLPAMIRIADLLQRQSRYSGQPYEAFALATKILHFSPTNVRAHLVMARSFSVTQNYRKASAQYDQLIILDPEFTIPPRERARVLFSDHQYSAARSQYNAMLGRGPDEQILADMSALTVRDPRMRGIFGPYVAGKVAGPGLRTELSRLSSSADEDVRLAAQRFVADYDAMLAWQKAYAMERDAKELKDYRNLSALGAYDALIAYEPTNTEALFDAGQINGALKRTKAAIDMYGNVLQVDPTHRDAQVASERAALDMSAKFGAREDYMRQRGRAGLANIDRQRATAWARLPLGDENEYLETGYTRIRYKPQDDRSLLGNIPYIRIQKRTPDDMTLLYGQVNVEEYQDRFSTRPTFDVGFNHMHSDWVNIRGGGYLENVAENGESLRQDIYRGGAYIGADFRPSRTWSAGGTYRYARYSDDNNLNQFDLYNDVSLTLPPKQLKLVQKFFYQGFTDQTQFANLPPTPFNQFGTVHPYFAPKNFAQLEFRVEWWHWLSRDYFIHSNQCWYSLQYGISTDNNVVTYNNFKGLFNYDVCNWMTVGAEANVLLSSQYKLYTGMGFIEFRMPR